MRTRLFTTAIVMALQLLSATASQAQEAQQDQPSKTLPAKTLMVWGSRITVPTKPESEQTRLIWGARISKPMDIQQAQTPSDTPRSDAAKGGRSAPHPDTH